MSSSSELTSYWNIFPVKGLGWFESAGLRHTPSGDAELADITETEGGVRGRSATRICIYNIHSVTARMIFAPNIDMHERHPLCLSMNTNSLAIM